MGDRILAIETSCDETAAVVERATRPLVGGASQIDRHAARRRRAEIASRAHVEMLVPVVAEALVEAGVADDEIDAVCHRRPRPGGSLLVG